MLFILTLGGNIWIESTLLGNEPSPMVFIREELVDIICNLKKIKIKDKEDE